MVKMGAVLNDCKTGIEPPVKKSFRGLQCLYDITRITGTPGKPLDVRIREVANTLPRAFPHPLDIYCRITAGGQKLTTPNFKNTGNMYTADILVQGKSAGKLEVGYLKTRQKAKADLEEQDILFIHAVAEQLGIIIGKQQTEDALKESEERFSRALDINPAIIAVTRLRDGRIIDVNDNYLRFYGYTRKEAMKQLLFDAGQWGNKADRARFLQVLEKQGVVSDVEATVPIKNGGERDVLFSANLVTLHGEEYVFVVTLDITEQKRRQEFLRSVCDASPSAIFVLQGEKLKYTNRQFQMITGFDQAEMRDANLLDIVPGADKDVVRSNIAYTLESQKPYPSEYRILHKNGRTKWVMQTVALIHYEGKEAVLGSLMDITERKSLERKVIEYEELNKMKVGILATVSHELRTPLAAVKGYATMILDYYPKLKKEETIEYLISINNSADKLNDLVTNLIDASRMDSGLLELQMSPASITGLIKSAVRLASLRIKDHVIIAGLPARLPRGMINVQRIKQVIDNLINNAAKYSPGGTEIVVSAVNKVKEIQISVTDHGRGIPTSELKKIFDRMYKAEHRFYSGADGMGLGLHICQRLVEAHGGTIWAESLQGQGATIRFTLPVVP
jgi:PAS domain S-box-containing protein